MNKTFREHAEEYAEEYTRLLKLEKWCRDKAIPALNNIESLDKFIELSKIGDRRGEWCSLQAKEALEALPKEGEK